MLYLIYLLFAIPMLCALLSFIPFFSSDSLSNISRIASIISFLLCVQLYIIVDDIGIITGNYFYLDALGIWILFILSIMYILVSFVSRDYLIRVESQYLNNKNYITHYYSLFHLFVFIMVVIPCLDNMGLMWVAIEATTLISALFVAFKFTNLSVEAAWKYVMVCTVGICLALLGTLILYYAQMNFSSDYPKLALNWVELMRSAKHFDSSVVKFAFLFIFVGYGTKLGLAPMHTWLPDAYSLAPSPISGLLSGGLSTCVVYVILKNVLIVKQCLPIGFINGFFLTFGLFSIVLVLPFLLVQRELKRMLAYSSVENMGLLSIAIGLNSSVAATGLLFHMFNHALIKFSLFYLAGRIIHDFGTNNIMRIHGMLISSPRLARTLLFSAFAVAGFPPFGMFFSKLLIIQGVFADGLNITGITLLVLLVGIFFGFFYHIIRMLSSSRTLHVSEQFNGFDSNIVLVTLLVSIFSIIMLTDTFGTLLQQASAIVGGATIK